MNKVMISGRLTKDIKLRYSQAGTAVASFSVALDRGKDQNGNSRGADYPNCIAFGKTAEALSKWSSGKGGRILIEGRIQTGSYTNTKGDKVYTTDVVADRIDIIDFRAKDEPQPQFDVPEGFEMVEDDDIPF